MPLEMAQKENLPPPWGLCDLAAQIFSKRCKIESYCVESLARTGRAERRGLRSSLVEDDTDEGGVAGFSQTGNTNFGFAPVLDKFIDRSWRVV